jgi:hypothetical protein
VGLRGRHLVHLGEPAKTYTANGTYAVTLTVTDPQGATGTANVQIGVGNTAPTVTITSPANGQLVSFGDTVPFSVTVTDPEDGTIDCSGVTMTYVLATTATAPDHERDRLLGSITIPIDGEHDDAANIFAIFDASYTDDGGLTTTVQHTLQPRKRQAEHYGASSGIAQISKHRPRAARPSATSTTGTGSRSRRTG